MEKRCEGVNANESGLGRGIGMGCLAKRGDA